MKPFVLLLTTALLSSCMHMGVPMTHGGSDRQPATEPVLEKEVEAGYVRANAVFPSLEIGKEVLFTIKLVYSRTQRPISGANTSLHVQYAHKPQSGRVEGMPMTSQHADSAHAQRIEEEDNIGVELHLEEGKEAGVYSISYTSYKEGTYTIMFHVTALGDVKLEPEISIEAERTVAGKGHAHKGEMMGMGGAATSLIMGAALMGAIMLAMLITQGGIH